MSRDLSFSIQLPYILLGFSTTTDPLDALHRTLEEFCKDVPIQLWEPSSEPDDNFEYDVPSGVSEAGKAWQKREKAHKQWAGQSKKWWADQERKTWRLEAAQGWILRSGVKSTVGCEEVGKWREGDRELTSREKGFLGQDVWRYPFVVQRNDIPSADFKIIMNELGDILKVLDRACNNSRTNNFRIICNERCRMHIGLSSTKGPNWDLETLSKTLLTVVAWERELTAIDTMAGIMDCVYLSRFLEHRGLQELAKEKNDVWLALPKQTKTKWNIEKEEWQSGIELEEATALDDPAVDLWKHIHSIVSEGEGTVGDLLKSMDQCQMAVGFTLIHGAEGERPSTSSSSAVFNSLPFVGREESPKVEAIVFQSHRSTLDITEIAAYVDTISCLMVKVIEMSEPLLCSMIEEFRTKAKAHKHTPKDSVLKLLTWLGVSRDTVKHYSEYLPDGNEWGDKSPEAEYQIAMRRATRQFEKIIKIVEEERRRARQYVPTFIERYELACGFQRTKKSKLLRLLEEEEKRRDKYDGSSDNGKLKRLQEVALDDQGG